MQKFESGVGTETGKGPSQLAFTCSKSAIETLEKSVNMFKVKVNDIIRKIHRKMESLFVNSVAGVRLNLYSITKNVVL